MSTPTTQTSDELAAPAASNAVVANTATTATSSASSASVVTSTVTTSSSPKRTISVGEYHEKARSKPTYANETLFDGMEDLDMEEGEEDGSDRPLADAGALSTPRGGGDDDSTPSTTVTSRTNPVRDPWMPSPSEIRSRYGNTSPLGQYALYSCSAINDDDVTKELDFDPATDQRRDYYIGLFHELRFYGNKKHSRKSKVTEWEA
ncbi:hypothetical protein PR001_g32744, partial [Phytophthora rubi]